MFRIVNLRTQIVWPDEKGESERIFKNGEEAAEAAKNLNTVTELGWNIYVPRAHELNPHGVRADLQDWFEGDVRVRREDKWQVRKILSSEDWRKLQAEKIASGAFKPVPWASHPKWIEWSSKSPQCDHFIHCSTKDENAIAYTKNEEAGSMDIRTRISPSKYFEKFVSAEYRDLYVREWLLAWTKYISAVELKFASTREEIRHVYEIGPDSCMSGPSSKFFHRKEAPHPAEAYAGGDLAIAYTIRKNGKISSRALVWPEKKVGGRRYGSEANLLGDLLKAEGYYQQAPSFENARLLLIDAVPYTKKPMTFVCPYIDSPSQYVSCHEEEKVLKLHDRKTEGRVSGNTQAGYLAFPLPFLSDFSGKMFCPTSDPAVTVFVSQRKSETWATSEASEHAYTCCLKNRLYSKKKCPPTLVMAGDFITCVCPYALDKLTIIKCEYYGCNVFRKDTENVITGYEPDGSFIRERWSYAAIRAFTFCYGEHKFALWLKSNLPWASVYPAHEEHRHPTSRHMKFGPATYPCRVTKENADKYLRRAVFHPNGEAMWAVTEYADAEKIEIALAEGQQE